MSAAVSQPSLPPELAALEDKLAVFKPPYDSSSICGLHGPQSAPFCAECDKFFPDQVEARKIAQAQIAGGPGFVSLSEVQRMIQQAIQEERAFQAWKANEQVKLEAEAKTKAEAEAAAKQGAPS
jgi:hypothetical protein